MAEWHAACPFYKCVTKNLESTQEAKVRPSKTPGPDSSTDRREIMKDGSKDFESIQKFVILFLDLVSSPVSIVFFPHHHDKSS